MRYLSDDWFEAAASAIERSSTPAPARLVVDQHVEGTVRWRVILDPAGSELRRLESSATTAGTETADATFAQSAATARAVASGAADAHQAFLLGQIRFEGSIDRLVANRRALDWLAAALEPLMADTTFD